MSRTSRSLRESNDAEPISASKNGSANVRAAEPVDCGIDPAARARFTAMNALSSAMAHELSQPLGAAANYIETSMLALRECFENIQELAVTVENAGRQTARAIELVRRMRRFVVDGTVKKCPEELDALLADAWASVGWNPDVHLITDIAPEAGVVMVERIHFEAVLANLLLNAVQAMQSETVRRIRASARIESGSVVIRIEDSGRGIPDEALPCLFEPLFTTRFGGMGLGLAICQTLVEAHDGTIRAEPHEPGRGALFVITLPADSER
jgi:two-component system sensor kinase FixL